MTDALRDAAQQALACLENATSFISKKARDRTPAAVVALRAALAAPAVPPQPLGYITPHAHKFLRGCKSQTANITTAIYRRRQDDTDVPIYTAPPVKQSLTTTAAPTAQPSKSNPQR